MASATDPKKPRKTTRTASRPAAATAVEAASAAQAAASFDRAQLGESVRVYALAKLLGVTSREVIAALAELGEKKVAQSSLTRGDAEKLLDSLAPPAKKPARKSTRKSTRSTAPKKAAADPAVVNDEPVEAAQAEDADKLRDRVRKNVDNEIHQIEERVEAKLPLDTITPDVTPVPESSPYTPLFVPPGAETGEGSGEDAGEEAAPANRRGRRRVSQRRKQQPVEQSQETAEATPEPEPRVESHLDEAPEPEEVAQVEEPVAIKGSTRLEAQRRRRTEMRESGRNKKHIVSQAEFLARRESVERTMVVRERPRHDGGGLLTQVGVLEDDLLVEHFVTTEAQASMIGNIYLGRVQNVLPAMEAAFIDIGTGRNGVLYSSEVDWKNAGLGGRGRRIEQALRSGDQVLVQISKDPMGHKGPRLTTQISLPGRFLVYVPGGRSAGISRKLPAPERKRLKDILGRVIPGKGGAIIRTAAENVPEEAIAADVRRLHNLWEDVQKRAEAEKQSKRATPVTLYEEPDMLVKVVRDLFNEDFSSLVIDGKRSWSTVHSYVKSVAPDLADRLVKYDRREHAGKDAFEYYRVDEQIHKALGRKVWLPSGGYLIIDRTEAMIVVDVNTGKFTGAGGNLEETVTRNNLEAAEEIVRQIRLRDLGGMIVIDFIDMVLPENQDLVLRRLKEALGRDHTRHQVSEVTSLGLVQMTRKRIGTGLVETFTSECPQCEGTGLIFHEDPVDGDEYGHAADSAERAERAARRSEDIRAATPQAEDTAELSTDADLEKMAASVITIEEQVPGHDSDDKEKRASRRRGRRGGGRGRGARDRADGQANDKRREEDNETPVNDWERIAAEAVDTARALDPDEPSDADYVAETGEKSFAEAVSEFEASPRRRRSTRGNSRSDRRPRKEQFTAQQDSGEHKEQPVAAPVETKSPVGEETQRRASRGRRRAVRRSAASGRTEIRRDAKQPVRTDVDKRPEPEAASSPGARGRRRATRRSSSRG